MQLEDAEKLAKQFIQEIVDYCAKVKIVGSIRRRKPQVHDIDLVIIVKPECWWNFTLKPRKISKSIVDGTQVKRIIYKGKQFDLYMAEQQTYGPLILIRTGSAQHNIRLSQRALSMGMKLSHKGLIKDKNVIASTEKEIFTSLNLPYVEPEQRE